MSEEAFPADLILAMFYSDLPIDQRSQPFDDDVDVDLALMAFHGLLPTVVASILGSGGVTGLLAWQYRNLWLALLATVTVCICAIRLVLVVTFPTKGSPSLTARRVLDVQTRYGVCTLIYCVTIALIVIYLTRFHTAQVLCLSLIGGFCICIGLASRAGMSPWISQASGGVLLTSMAYSMVRSGFGLRWIGAAVICFFGYQYFYTLDTQYRLVVEQFRIRRQLRLLSEQDSLTGLVNRRHFETSLVNLCAQAVSFAILFIDLDRFKHVNDAYGHGAGDAVLVQVGERLSATIRGTDMLARLGGDEFAILQTPLLSSDAASSLAARINRDLGEPFQVAGHKVSIGASIGIRLSESGSRDAHVLLTKADQALYRVKQAGGGGFMLATA